MNNRCWTKWKAKNVNATNEALSEKNCVFSVIKCGLMDQEVNTFRFLSQYYFLNISSWPYGRDRCSSRLFAGFSACI